MKTRFLLEESVHALRFNLLRSLLTIIGIVVGISSVTAMLGLGEGLSTNILDRFSSFIQGDLTVTGDITLQDYDWISSQPYVDGRIATVQISGTNVVVFGNDYSPTVQSALGDYQKVMKYTVQDGNVYDFEDRSFTDRVAVVSDGFYNTVLDDTGQSVLGQPLTINGQNYTVIGIIKANASSFTRGDGLVLLPHAAAVGLLTNSSSFSSMALLLKEPSYYEIIGKNILASLNASRQLASDSTDDFNVETAQSFIETAQQTAQMISIFLGVIGGIALFVGGIGTMNMMLTTVTERTKEIGLRKAVGARDRDILLQVLIEAIMLTTLGGIIGIALSIGGAHLINQFATGTNSISILIDLKVITLAASVAIAVGVVFGLYPAYNASKLQPVDALRTE